MLTAEEFGLLFEKSNDENFESFWSATIILKNGSFRS